MGRDYNVQKILTSLLEWHILKNVQAQTSFDVFISVFALYISHLRRETLSHGNATFYSQVWHLLNWDNVLSSSLNEVSVLLHFSKVVEEPKPLYQEVVKWRRKIKTNHFIIYNHFLILINQLRFFCLITFDWPCGWKNGNYYLEKRQWQEGNEKASLNWHFLIRPN